MESDKAGGELIARAVEWLVALDAGSVDQQSFESWRSADPRHGAAFAQVAATWERTGDLRLSAARPGRAVDEDATPAYDAASGADAHFVKTSSTGTLSRRRVLTAGGAALLVAASGGAALLLREGRDRIQTAVGERRSMRLPDGSRAELNTDSILSWHFGKKRSVWLERGEALIAVATDRALPFVLHGGGVEARLRQGSYNLRLHDNGPELTAFSGGGEIHRSDNGWMPLAPMQAVSDLDGRIRTAVVSPADVEAVSAWRRGEIIFNGMRLDAAVGEFNRYLDKKLVIGDAVTGAIRLGGRFFIDDPASFLRSLRQGFDVMAEVGPDSIVLRAA